LEEREVYGRMGSELNIFIEIYSPQGPTFVAMESDAPEVSYPVPRSKTGVHGPKGVYIRGTGPPGWGLDVGRTSSDLALETAFCYEMSNKCDLSEKKPKTHKGL
jgi:hypothetical protein